MEKRLFTSESVTEGHPDKICDQISDAVLDDIYAHDPMARVACETTVTTGQVLVMGEITTEAYVDSVKALMWGSALVLLASIVAHVVIKAVKGEDENANKVIGTAAVGAIAVFVASFFSHWTLT